LILFYRSYTADEKGEGVLNKNGYVLDTAITQDVTLVSGNERHFQRIISLFGQLDFEQWNVNAPFIQADKMKSSES
jgi:hypothetical protein